ncbi:hypothetical protein ACQY0O_000099 [Thecaphora frezii]
MVEHGADSAPSPTASSSCPSVASASRSSSSSAAASSSTPASSAHDASPITSLDRRLYLAIDCGGTKAAAVISDRNGDVVGRGFGGPANFTDVGLDSFLLSVQDAIRQALAQCEGIRWPPMALPLGVAGHAPPLFEAAWFGIAGVDSEGDVQQLTPYLASLLSLPYPSNRLMVANDTSLLAAPVRDPAYPEMRSGVVVIAGTGSIVMSFKEDQDGMLQTLGRVGGFGWLLGDEGSGYWVGRDALRFVLDQADRDRIGGGCMFGGAILEATSTGNRRDAVEEHNHLLRDRILDLWNLSSTDELLNAIYSNRAPAQPRSPDPRPGCAAAPMALSNDDGIIVVGSSVGVMDANAHGLRVETKAGLGAADDGLGRLMPPPAAAAPQLGAASPIPSLSPYGSIVSLASCSTDSIGESVGELMGCSLPSSGGGRSSGVDDDGNDDGDNGEMLLYHDAPGHDFAESARTTKSAARASRAAAEVGADATATTTTTTATTSSGPMLQERKHRLASLAPLVFHLALQHGDINSVAILRGQARRLAWQIASVFPRDAGAAGYMEPATSVLCMGGSLLGVEGYQRLLEEELGAMGLRFGRSVFVHDPAKSGAIALAKMWEGRMQPGDDGSDR